jgi:hypothetical protein
MIRRLWPAFANSRDLPPAGKVLRKIVAWLATVAAGLAVSTLSAAANVLIAVNKDTQQMSVSVDGISRYEFTVSTGRAGYGTPNGTYHPQRMAKSWFSREYYNSPMPHSIFFHRGYAIHGSYEINRLGGPASHGCIRLHPANAATLFALVQKEGMQATTIRVYGSGAAAPRRRTFESPPAEELQPYYRPFDMPFRPFEPSRVIEPT